MSNLFQMFAGDEVITDTSFHTVEADGVHVFYRTAGSRDAPVVLLLHGFPASSSIFRELIPRLATNYRVIAPDLPGFGLTRVPPEREYHYSFDALTFTAQAFMEALGLSQYALYVFDYSAPVAFRLAVTHPERVTAIVPNCDDPHRIGRNASSPDAWDLIRRYWLEPTPQNRAAVLPLLTLDGTCWEQDAGVEEPECVCWEGTGDDALACF